MDSPQASKWKSGSIVDLSESQRWIWLFASTPITPLDYRQTCFHWQQKKPSVLQRPVPFSPSSGIVRVLVLMQSEREQHRHRGAKRYKERVRPFTTRRLVRHTSFVCIVFQCRVRLPDMRYGFFSSFARSVHVRLSRGGRH